MGDNESRYEIPKRLDRYLATLSTLYAQQGERLLQEIIVNAHARIHEAINNDNWNDNIYLHVLYLAVPKSLFLASTQHKDAIEKRIVEDLNQIHHVRDESIHEAFLEMEVGTDSDWREDSGVLITGSRVVAPDATKRIWGAKGFRLFLSHRSKAKKETARLKERLSIFGVSAFVAHEDIHPTKKWQDEIENALASMDGLAALMTEDFHTSEWTDQEVGYAFARDVQIIAVKLGMDPYGFIGKFQALPSTWETAAEDIVKILIKRDQMLNAFIQAMRDCQNFDNGNIMAKALAGIEKLSGEQIDELVAAYNSNRQIQWSYGFNGAKPRDFGPGAASYLNRLGTRRFAVNDTGLLEAVS